jgi:16S rRNA (guanine527-N7)-methyltransferase
MKMMNDDARRLLAGGMREMGIPFGEGTIEKIDLFLRELLRWNRKTNLIGKSDVETIILRHVLDSLSCFRLLESPDRTILDVGAGAGFPSVVLALIDPSRSIDAVERRGKRAAFLRNVACILGLERFRVIQADARELDERYDIVLFRAVGDLESLYGISRRVVKEDGMIIAFKGKISEINREMERLRESVGPEEDLRMRVEKVKIPHLSDEERNIVIIETG